LSLHKNAIVNDEYNKTSNKLVMIVTVCTIALEGAEKKLRRPNNGKVQEK
jgi:hypothetical protein